MLLSIFVMADMGIFIRHILFRVIEQVAAEDDDISLHIIDRVRSRPAACSYS